MRADLEASQIWPAVGIFKRVDRRGRPRKAPRRLRLCWRCMHVRAGVASWEHGRLAGSRPRADERGKGRLHSLVSGAALTLGELTLRDLALLAKAAQWAGGELGVEHGSTWRWHKG